MFGPCGAVCGCPGCRGVWLGPLAFAISSDTTQRAWAAKYCTSGDDWSVLVLETIEKRSRLGTGGRQDVVTLGIAKTLSDHERASPGEDISAVDVPPSGER
jgi:hypothetical protein